MSEDSNKTEEKQKRRGAPEEYLFKPGQSGNPAGRPKGKFSLTTLVIKKLQENPDKTDEIINWYIEQRREKVWDKIDSDPPKEMVMSGDWQPIQITIKGKDDNVSS